MKLNQIKNVFFNTLFPPLCIACKKHLSAKKQRTLFLCNDCEKQITAASGFSCPRCGGRLPAGRHGLPTLRNTCHPEEKFILAAATSFSNEAVRALIHALKYNNMKGALVPLHSIIKRYVNTWMSDILVASNVPVLIPVPLHRRRERVRGFNQAVLIAETLIFNVGCPHIEINNLIRIKNTKSQTELKDYKERAKNVAGSFILKHPERIVGKNIILVDDVFTSGATMREAVRIVKQAGAKKIIAFVIAKA